MIEFSSLHLQWVQKEQYHQHRLMHQRNIYLFNSQHQSFVMTTDHQYKGCSKKVAPKFFIIFSARELFFEILQISLLKSFTSNWLPNKM